MKKTLITLALIAVTATATASQSAATRLDEALIDMASECIDTKHNGEATDANIIDCIKQAALISELITDQLVSDLLD